MLSQTTCVPLSAYEVQIVQNIANQIDLQGKASAYYNWL